LRNSTRLAQPCNLYALSPYLSFCEPLLAGEKSVIETVINRLIALFWHPLSDFDLDRGNQFGRLITYGIIMMIPAGLLSVLLSSFALIGVILLRRSS
jgi:hypothetical protein